MSATAMENGQVPQPGDIVWAKAGKWPWWPALVCEHALKHAQFVKKIKNRNMIHVYFFDEVITTSWLQRKFVAQFTSYGECLPAGPFFDNSRNIKRVLMAKRAEAMLSIDPQLRIEQVVKKSTTLMPSDDLDICDEDSVSSSDGCGTVEDEEETDELSVSCNPEENESPEEDSSETEEVSWKSCVQIDDREQAESASDTVCDSDSAGKPDGKILTETHSKTTSEHLATCDGSPSVVKSPSGDADDAVKLTADNSEKAAAATARRGLEEHIISESQEIAGGSVGLSEVEKNDGTKTLSRDALLSVESVDMREAKLTSEKARKCGVLAYSSLCKNVLSKNNPKIILVPVETSHPTHRVEEKNSTQGRNVPKNMVLIQAPETILLTPRVVASPDHTGYVVADSSQSISGGASAVCGKECPGSTYSVEKSADGIDVEKQTTDEKFKSAETDSLASAMTKSVARGEPLLKGILRKADHVSFPDHNKKANSIVEAVTGKKKVTGAKTCRLAEIAKMITSSCPEENEATANVERIAAGINSSVSVLPARGGKKTRKISDTSLDMEDVEPDSTEPKRPAARATHNRKRKVHFALDSAELEPGLSSSDSSHAIAKMPEDGGIGEVFKTPTVKIRRMVNAATPASSSVAKNAAGVPPSNLERAHSSSLSGNIRRNKTDNDGTGKLVSDKSLVENLNSNDDVIICGVSLPLNVPSGRGTRKTRAVKASQVRASVTQNRSHPTVLLETLETSCTASGPSVVGRNYSREGSHVSRHTQMVLEEHPSVRKVSRKPRQSAATSDTDNGRSVNLQVSVTSNGITTLSDSDLTGQARVVLSRTGTQNGSYSLPDGGPRRNPGGAHALPVPVGRMVAPILSNLAAVGTPRCGVRVSNVGNFRAQLPALRPTNQAASKPSAIFRVPTLPVCQNYHGASFPVPRKRTIRKNLRQTLPSNPGEVRQSTVTADWISHGSTLVDFSHSSEMAGDMDVDSLAGFLSFDSGTTWTPSCLNSGAECSTSSVHPPTSCRVSEVVFPSRGAEQADGLTAEISTGENAGHRCTAQPARVAPASPSLFTGSIPVSSRMPVRQALTIWPDSSQTSCTEAGSDFIGSMSPSYYPSTTCSILESTLELVKQTHAAALSAVKRVRSELLLDVETRCLELVREINTRHCQIISEMERHHCVLVEELSKLHMLALQSDQRTMNTSNLTRPNLMPWMSGCVTRDSTTTGLANSTSDGQYQMTLFAMETFKNLYVDTFRKMVAADRNRQE